jgi:hypothetical protein
MHDLAQRPGRCRTDALRWGIRRLELRELLLEVLELAQQPVIFGVSELRRIFLVVEAVGTLEHGTQLRRAFGRRCPILDRFSQFARDLRHDPEDTD